MGNNSRAYWDERYGQAFDLTTAGYAGSTLTLAKALYRRMAGSVDRLLKDHRLQLAGPTLDVGSGTGFWLDYWRGRIPQGSLTSVEVSEYALGRLREREGDDRVLRRDVTAEDFLDVGSTFQVISVMNVLLCVTNELEFTRGVRNLSRVLDKDGILLIMDPVILHRWWGEPFTEESSSMARPLDRWMEVFDAAGLRLIDVRPVTALLSNPADTKYRATFQALKRYWRLFLQANQRLERFAPAVCRGVEMLDDLLVRSGFAPSTKLMLVRHVDAVANRTARNAG